MLTVKRVTVPTIVVMSVSPYLVESAKTGAVSHPTDMDTEVLENTTSVETQMVSPMSGVIPWMTRDGSFVTSGPAMSVTKLFLNLKTWKS